MQSMQQNCNLSKRLTCCYSNMCRKWMIPVRKPTVWVTLLRDLHRICQNIRQSQLLHAIELYQRDIEIHWASKETYNFLEWCPLKSTASKWMIFGLMLATVLLITHVKKQRNRMCQKLDKCLQITTSPISKSQKLLPFHRADFRTLQ